QALVECIWSTGRVGMQPAPAEALAELRRFNYERIYTQPTSMSQGRAVVGVLRALVDYFAEDPARLPPSQRHPDADPDPVRRAVTYVAGMTDRFAFEAAVGRLGWDPTRLPRGFDVPVPG
ncbi:MAG: HD domain-containing protein, partial [Acidimicrobiales bacterium]